MPTVHELADLVLEARKTAWANTDPTTAIVVITGHQYSMNAKRGGVTGVGVCHGGLTAGTRQSREVRL